MRSPRSKSPDPTAARPSADAPSGGPLFIVFEGIEGSGKSTQIRLVADELRRCGVDPFVTREPGGTPAGEAIRAVVLDEKLPLDGVAELMLMLAARSAFVRQAVQPALDAGRVVLADRYQLSTFAYQGGGRGISLEKLRSLNDLATGGVSPDLCILLDVDVEVGQRRGGRPGGRDRIEGEGLAFHQRVADAYRRLAASEPNVALVDGNGEIQEVRAAVWKALSSRFPETFPARGC